MTKTDQPVARRQLIQQYPRAQAYLDNYDKHLAKRSSILAVVKVGGGIIEDRDLMADCVKAIVGLVDLGYLPVIVHGGGPQITQALSGMSQSPAFIDGLRVTSVEAIDLVAQALTGVNQQLVVQLAEASVAASGLSEVFLAEVLDREKYGEVGRVTSVARKEIDKAISRGSVPVVSCLGHSLDWRALNVNGDDAAAELVAALSPQEYVSFTPTGGVNGADGGLIHHIATSRVTSLESSGQLSGGMLKKVAEAVRLIDDGVVEKVIVVHPRHLIEELFSEDGYGTVISQG